MDGTAEKPFLSDNIIRENEDEVKSLNSFEKPPKPDHVLFLDKSARPVSWLIKDFWQDFADSKTKRPPFSYLNIDRVNFFNMVGLKADSDGKNIETKEVFQPYHFDQQIKNNSPEVLESLRQIKVAIRSQYIDEKMIDLDGDIEEQILNLPTKLDGKNLLIIDETRRSGSTLHIAMKVLKLAIPELKTVKGDYFWHSVTVPSGDSGSGQTDLAGAPVWYDKDKTEGRGTGEQSDTYNAYMYEKNPTPKNLLRKIGSCALSTPMVKIDENGNYSYYKDTSAWQLAKDFLKLRQDYRSGKVLHMPAANIDYEQSVEILKRQGFPTEINKFGEEAVVGANELRDQRRDQF